MPPRRDPANSISPSQLDTMDCRLRWYWGYKKGYRPLHVNENLALGTGVHLGLEYHYGKKGDPVRAFLDWADTEIARIDSKWTDDLEKMRDVRQLGEAMLTGYLEHYRGRDAFDVLATEHTIMRALPDPTTGRPSPYHVTVRLDGVIRDHKTGRLMSLEHKTYKRFDDSHFPRDHQFTLQTWCGQDLVETMGLKEEIIGVLYNGLRAQMPGPKVTAPLFERHFIERNQHQIDVILHRAYWQKHEFAQPDLMIYPQPNVVKCGRCDFADADGPCSAYMRGEDYQQILDELFVTRSSGPRPEATDAGTTNGVMEPPTGGTTRGAGAARVILPDTSKRKGSLKDRLK